MLFLLFIFFVEFFVTPKLDQINKTTKKIKMDQKS
jgi:hypothetical protein